jgi:hypothetical protein
MAGTPTSGPTVSPHFIVNPVRHQPLRPEQFNIVETSTGVNQVRATGPVSGNGFDITNSNTADTFRLGGLNSVHVNHTGLPAGTVNLATCTVVFTQTGLWTFNHGTGLYANARGAGSFRLAAVFAFGNRPYTTTCVLTGLTPVQVNNAVEGHSLIRPTFYDIGVHGSGLAARS